MASKNNFVRIKDAGTDSGVLFGGSDMILYVDSIAFNGQASTQFTVKGFQDTSLQTGETVLTNYNRRKTNVSYNGFTNPEITISGLISEGGIGNDTVVRDEGTYKTLTPIRLMQMVTSGRSFYLNDYVLTSLLKTADVDGNRFYSDDGMPVVVNSYSMTPILGNSGDKGINFSISFLEDKDNGI